MNPSLRQISFVVAVFAVFSNQLVWVGLVRLVLGNQGDPDSDWAAVIMHLPEQKEKKKNTHLVCD